jgi:hypothetical protein
LRGSSDTDASVDDELLCPELNDGIEDAEPEAEFSDAFDPAE